MGVVLAENSLRTWMIVFDGKKGHRPGRAAAVPLGDAPEPEAETGVVTNPLYPALEASMRLPRIVRTHVRRSGILH